MVITRQTSREMPNLRPDNFGSTDFQAIRAVRGDSREDNVDISDDQTVSDYMALQAERYQQLQRESGRTQRNANHIIELSLVEPQKRKPHATRNIVRYVNNPNQGGYLWDFIDWLLKEERNVIVGQELYNEIIEERNHAAEGHNLAYDMMRETTGQEKNEMRIRLANFQEIVSRFDTALTNYITRAHSGQVPDFE